MGDFASIGLYAGKSFFDRLGVTLQLRGEWMDEMSINKDILLYAYPNYDPYATGYKKVFITPQLSWSFGNFGIFALADIPVYQNVNKTQVVTELQATLGLSYRFFAMKSRFDKVEMGEFICPMHPEVTSTFMGACPKCGMDLEKK
jgi:hypothetical protein